MLAAVTGCSSGTSSPSQPAIADNAPPNVIIAGKVAGGEYDGLYPDSVKSQCCWLSPHAVLHFKPPEGSKAVLFHIYVPDLAIFRSDPQQIAFSSQGRVVKRYCCFRPGAYTLVLPISTLGLDRNEVQMDAGTVDIPVDQGINGDVRKLAVILSSIGFSHVVDRDRVPPLIVVRNGNDTRTYFYPAGVRAPHNARAFGGIYGDSANDLQCCWLSAHDEIHFDKPAGASVMYLSLYEPPVPPITSQQEGVTVRFDDGTTIERCCFRADHRRIPVPLPHNLIGKGGVVHFSMDMKTSWIPAKLGINGDTRRLAGILEQVDAH